MDFKAFIAGWASSFDYMNGGSRIEVPDFSRGFERDAAALAGDWRKVGDDLRRSIALVGRGQ
jgi:hypothetical protein